jgi:DNA-binding transcriptional MerR regulator
MELLTISQVAKEANVNITAIRYYERRGLIQLSHRTESGYRMFSYQVVEDIKFIKQSQDLGFTLEEIKNLMTISNNESSILHSDESYQFIIKKIEEVDSKIHKLNNMKLLLTNILRNTGHSI